MKKYIILLLPLLLYAKNNLVIAAEIQKRNIKILVVPEHGFYSIDNGKPVGITAELIFNFRHYVEKIDGNINVQVIPVERDKIMSSLISEKGDIAAANLTITSARKEDVLFSEPIISDVKEILVSNQDFPYLKSPQQLSGQTVWVRENSSHIETIRSLNAELYSLGIEPVHLKFIDRNYRDHQVVQMVMSGSIGLMVLDEHKAKMLLEHYESLRLHTRATLRDNAKLGWAFNTNDKASKALVDNFVLGIQKGTLTGNVIYNRYIKNDELIGELIEQGSLIELSSVPALFEHYGKQYGFDPLLLKSVSYQESRFNNETTSHAGAVGIMQVLPATAKDRYINIQDVQNIKDNIHAGAKYLRFIKSRYFNNNELPFSEQVNFTLAAYNAGPAKIRRMRRLAEQYGLDRNKWFGNVELMARKYIGEETFDYVRNVNYYYAIYRGVENIERANSSAYF